MGLALAAVRLQLPNATHDLTTTYTHKAGAEIAPFVCIDESAVSASQAGSFPSQYPGRTPGLNRYQKLPSLPLVSLPAQNHYVFLRHKKATFGSHSHLDLLQLKKTLPEKMSIPIPKSEGPGIGFQKGRNRYQFQLPLFCRFWYQF